MRRAEHIGALRHEVHAAEHDVVGFGTVGDLAGETKRVAGVVGELDHFVALIVMAEDDQPVAELRARRGNARRPSRRRTGRDTVSGRGCRSEMCSFSNSVRSGISVGIVIEIKLYGS